MPRDNLHNFKWSFKSKLGARAFAAAVGELYLRDIEQRVNGLLWNYKSVEMFKSSEEKKQARKLQDARAEKLTSLQATKLTSG